MYIKTSSWYYRFLKSCGTSGFKYNSTLTVCSLFWQTVWSLLKIFFWTTLVILLSCIPVDIFLSKILGLTLFTAPWYYLAIGIPLGALAWVLVIGILGGTGFLIAKGCSMAKNKIEDKLEDTHITMPQVITKMWQFKKDKLCPLVEVREE